MLVADGADDDVCAVGMSDAIIGDGETFAPDDDLQLAALPPTRNIAAPTSPSTQARQNIGGMSPLLLSLTITSFSYFLSLSFQPLSPSFLPLSP